MDRKHNNLAQPETEWIVKKNKDISNTSNPYDHTGIKLESEDQQAEPK